MELTSYEKILLKEYTQGKENAEELLENALARLEQGEPIGYIVGYQYFYNLCLSVDRNVLIPRPDTEILCEYAIKHLIHGGRFADLCTGSGAIGLTVLYNRTDTRGELSDISEKALDVARLNANSYRLSERATIVRKDVLSGTPLEGLYDAILSNPPYISSEKMDRYPSLSYEPRIALDAGEDDMIFYRSIIRNYRQNLTEKGFFLFEIGFDQEEKIKAIARDNGYNVNILRDYGNNPRVAVLDKEDNTYEN